MSPDIHVSSTPPQPPPKRSRSTAAVILASIVGLLGAIALLGGLALAAAHTFVRDDDGYYTTNSEHLQSTGYAISTDEIDLGDDSSAVSAEDFVPSLRFNVSASEGEQPLFVGIASHDDARRYLSGFAHSEVTDLRSDGPEYEQRRGAAPAGIPASEDFWVDQSQGSGEQAVELEVEEGHWTAVVMNADASRGIDVEAEAGAQISWLIWVGIGFTVVGLAMLALATLGMTRGGGGTDRNRVNPNSHEEVLV